MRRSLAACSAYEENLDCKSSIGPALRLGGPSGALQVGDAEAMRRLCGGYAEVMRSRTGGL
jgi:hypothetical protein